jgi:hypothetical protein
LSYWQAGELIHLAVGKNQLLIVKELIEKHSVAPTASGEVSFGQRYNNYGIACV